MVRKLPLRVRYQALVQDRVQLKGRLLVKELPRLRELCLSTNTEIEVVTDFGLNTAYDCSTITISLQAVLVLQCQRCLSQIDWQADLQNELAIVHSEAQARQLPRNADYYICPSDKLELIELIEDELLLTLPQNPIHNNQDECDPEVINQLCSYTKQFKRDNPFSKLKNL